MSTPVLTGRLTGDVAVLPASYAQELMWTIHCTAPESVAYNVPRAFVLRGRLDRDALQSAFDALVTRHEILRTTYAFEGEQAVQIVHPPQPVAIATLDLRGHRPESEAARIVRERGLQPFDLGREAPLRVTLLRLDDDEHVLHIATHHIASDGWSGEVMLRDLAGSYASTHAGGTAALTPLPIQYGDYAGWQRERFRGGELDATLAYWRDELAEVATDMALPADFSRPPVARDAATSATLTLTRAQAAAVKALGRRYDATLYMTLLAAYQSLLHRYSGLADILVGSPVAGRAAAETHDLIGYFANTIVLRGRFAGDPPFAEVLEAGRAASLRAFDHQEVPFEKLMLELHGRRDAGHAPLVQAVLTILTDGDERPRPFGDLTIAPFAAQDETTKFDLTLFAAERDGEIVLTLRGLADMFGVQTLERLLGHLRTLLAAAAAGPATRVSKLPLLTVAERESLQAWNATERPQSGESVVALFASAAARRPQAVAVRDGNRSLTYRELDARSNRLAAALLRRGARAGTTVGVLLGRSAELIVTFLAVMKTGAAYVPLAPDAPPERLRRQLGEAGVQAVVTLAEYAPRCAAGVPIVALDRDRAAIEAEAGEPPAHAVDPRTAAYVLFTSGSTGTPKGVTVTHANLANYAGAVARTIGARDDMTFGMVSTPVADLGNTALYPALCSGATLVLFSEAAVTNPKCFAAQMERTPIDVLKITPSHLHALLDDAPSGIAILPRGWLILGGEPLSWSLVDDVLARPEAPRVLNHYGPTEATVGACTFEVTAATSARVRALGARTVPIGKPLDNVQLHVLDGHGELQPVGVPGELAITGEGVADGYFRRPELTAERFVTVPGIGRAYLTGDRVRRLACGDCEFLGRLDDQVKVRGFRVELGAIGSMLAAHPSVAQAIAVLRGGNGESQLVAYAVPATSSEDAATLEAALQAYLAERLPDYMLPRAIVVLDAFALTRNGKIDRSALPEPAPRPAPPADDEPATPTEISLAGMWAEVLRCERVGASDDFFALGGHSLLAIRVLGKISRAFGVRLPLRALFDTPVLRRLAETVDLEASLAQVERMSEEEATALLAARGVKGA